MPPHFSVPGLTCHTELPLRGSAGPVSHARFVLGDYQRQHCAFTPEELCFCSSSRALGAEGQAVLSLKPILSRFVERLCADLCLWCLAAVLIPVPGTFVFPRFAEIFVSMLQALRGKATPVAPPSPGCVYTAVTPSSVLSWPQNTTPFTQPQLLNTQQRAPHPALALLTQSAGSWDGHCRAEGVSCSDSTLLPCVPGANPPAPFLGSTLGLPAAAPRGCECAPRLLPQGGDARGQCLVCGELLVGCHGQCRSRLSVRVS